MKNIREYHIEAYWQAEALKRKRMAEFKEKIGEKIVVCLFIALEIVITYEFLRQLFELV